jgi:hypothetical protein
MPIFDMEFENGIYFVREVGRIDQADAELWTYYARRYAASSKTPIVALIDAYDVTYVTPEARRTFAIASRIPNLRGAAVAVKDFVNMQTSKVIALMAEDGHTHIFRSLEEARRFAVEQISSGASTG